jgi:hypothetical protein
MGLENKFLENLEGSERSEERRSQRRFFNAIFKNFEKNNDFCFYLKYWEIFYSISRNFSKFKIWTWKIKFYLQKSLKNDQIWNFKFTFLWNSKT